MGKRKQENKLWKKVKDALERKPYDYICSNPNSKRKKFREGFINIGLGGVIPDVIGIKDIGNRYEPRIEIISVEVKENLPNYRERHMDQVRRASAFAHKVFLAGPREFKPEEVELAVKEEIGLFELKSDTGKLKLIVPSRSFEPSESKIIELMRRLEFFKCTICNCYWNKNLGTTFGYRPRHSFSRNRAKEFNKFICHQCSEKLYDLHSGDLRERFAEEWKLKRTKRAVEKLTFRTKKLADKRETARMSKRIYKQNEMIKKIKRELRDSFNRKYNKMKRELRKVKRGLKSI